MAWWCTRASGDPGACHSYCEEAYCSHRAPLINLHDRISYLPRTWGLRDISAPSPEKQLIGLPTSPRPLTRWSSALLTFPSAADGLAVGAACLSGSLTLTASVGSAILIHKFPVAFGLSSFLRGAGWEGWRLHKGGAYTDLGNMEA